MENHHGKDGDVGTVPTFTTVERVGHFAVEHRALERGDAAALFKLLVTVAMFQRLRDELVTNILRSIPQADAAEITTASTLAKLASNSDCVHMRSNDKLLSACDLTKDAEKRGSCSAGAAIPCHLKRHTELLRRYGHFGKMPTSVALVVQELGSGDLNRLRDAVLTDTEDELERAQLLESRLSGAWRISDKLASMFLSLVAAPGMGLAKAPWAEGIDWTWFVVVDTNVDAFFATIGYGGNGTYAARRSFVQQLAREVDISAFKSDLPAYHPRLVQQAMFMFMSRSNRRASKADCNWSRPSSCEACASVLRERCPFG